MDKCEDPRTDHGIVDQLSLGISVVGQGSNQQWRLQKRAKFISCIRRL